MDNISIKKKFEDHYRSILADQYDNFIKASTTPIRRSIRINTLKTTVEKAKKSLSKHWKLTQVPWCSEGFWVKHKEGRLDIGNTIEHFRGHIYIQEAASMIPAAVLDPKPKELVLDLCASPGSKTTHIAALMKNSGTLIANELKKERLIPLQLNLQKTGVTNCLLSKYSAEKPLTIKFDKILLDAPCSGTGNIRRSLKTLINYNLNAIEKLAQAQKKMILNAYNALKPGTSMVYSTCSVEPIENEAIVDFLLSNSDAQIKQINLPIKRSLPITKYLNQSYNKETTKCLRIWPQDNDTEGFFICKIQKPA